MNEITVRLSRSIASHRRLRILSHLAQHDERTFTALAAELAVSLCAVST